MLQNCKDLIILGSGPAGYTAAIYAARAALSPLLITGNTPGGQLSITTDVENYPGFTSILGPDLMEKMREQAEHVGTQVIYDHIEKISIRKDSTIFLIGEKEFRTKSLIIATGAQAKWLNLESEEKFRGYGVSGCATCDGFFFKNQKVLVVGGGNTALEEALYLTKHASEVILIHRRDTLRGERILQNKVFENKKITIIWDTVLEEVLGDSNPKKVTGVKIKNTKTNKLNKIELNGVFIAIGHTPNTQLFKEILKMDKDGYIITKSSNSTETSIKNIFAAGDVQDKIYRQAITAAGTGCMAALEAVKFLEN